jgi:hypothetical protein
MIARYGLVVLACMAFSRQGALAADLAKVDRSIKKEPAYQSKSPKYCLVVIGPEAKTRIWLVRGPDRGWGRGLAGGRSCYRLRRRAELP